MKGEEYPERLNWSEIGLFSAILLNWKILSKILSVGISWKVTKGNRPHTKVLRLSGKLKESTNMCVIRERLLITDSKKFRKADKRKLDVKPTTVAARANLTTRSVSFGSVLKEL